MCTLFHEPASTLGTVPELHIADVLRSAEDLIQHSSRPVSESSVRRERRIEERGTNDAMASKVLPRPAL